MASIREAQRLREKWEDAALPVFDSAYKGQLGRVRNAVRRASPDTLQEVLAVQWEAEPALVQRAVQAFYDELVLEVGAVDAVEAIGITTLDFDAINDALFRLSQERAGLFSRLMTETSMRQTQEVIAGWLEEGEPLNVLVDRVSSVWTGPRPASAAVTETTSLVAQSQDTTWTVSGVVWGYEVRTAQDGLVRPRHTEVSRQGPYPLSDKTHLPPIDGDVNCRCFTVPVVNPPQTGL